jgi:hypothetical protein
MTFDGSILQRPEVLIPILGFLGLAVLATWAIFHATYPKKRDDD